MRVAVCISGEMRYFDEKIVKDGFKFIDELNPDIFISTWSHRGTSVDLDRNYSSFDKKDDDRLEEKILQNYRNIKKIEIESFNTWVDNLDNFNKDILGNRYSTNGLPITSPAQLYKLKKRNLLKSEYEEKNNFIYDVVIKVRPDSLFVESIDLSHLKDNTIYHLNFGKHAYWPNRIWDLFFFGDSKSMDYLSQAFDSLKELVENPFNNGLDRRDPSRLLFLQSQNCGIQNESLSTRVTNCYKGGDLDFNLNVIKSLNG